MKRTKEDLYTILLANDPLAPIQRLDALISADVLAIDRKLLETALLALEAIDTTVAELLVEGVLDSSRNFYLYQDQSLKLLVEEILQTSLDHRQFVKGLILLNETDLIFRFTAARKFKIADPSDKQLRINSWGKRYIQEKMLITQHGPLYTQLAENMKAYIRRDKAVYQEITQLLSQPIRPRIADRVITLNAALAVKLLS